MQKKKIDNYTIYLDRKLGEGSFGTVYLGEQDTTNLKVAIKMLSKKTSTIPLTKLTKTTTSKKPSIQKYKF